MSGPFTYTPFKGVEKESPANLPIPIVDVNSLLKTCSDKGTDLSSRFPHFVIPEFVIGAYPLPDRHINRVIFPIPQDEIVKLPPGKSLFLALGKRYPLKANKPTSVHIDLLLNIQALEIQINMNTQPLTSEQKAQLRTGIFTTDGKTYADDLRYMSHIQAALVLYGARKLSPVKLHVMDLGSTNGTYFIRQGIPETEALTPFTPYLIEPTPLLTALQNPQGTARINPGTPTPFTIVTLPGDSQSQYGYTAHFGILR